MGDNPTIAIRANSSEQKQRWKDAIDESGEYDSLSHLIRVSVQRELSGAHNGREDTETVESSRQLSELVTAVENMEGSLESVESELGRATDAMYESGSLVDEDTVTAVFSALPVGVGAATTAEGVSEGIDVSADTAAVALEQLAKSTKAVKRHEYENLNVENDTVTANWEGREIEIDDVTEAVKRRNPLYFKEA